MFEKKYLDLLILWTILFLGIIGTFANGDISKSNILSRQKRVVSHIQGEDRSVHITDVPYIVVIKHNNRVHCVGSILSKHVVITVAQCLRFATSEYHVISSTSRPNRGNTHNITDVRKHFGAVRSINGIALLTVHPPIVYNLYSQNIQLHAEPLLPGTFGTVSGWGFNCRVDRENRGTTLPRSLRSINVPIISHRDCVSRYRNHYAISDQELCTFDPERHCGHNDFGAPLVIRGTLAGLFLWSGPRSGDYNGQYPDVYVVLQNSVYRVWIMSNLGNIEAQF